MGAMSDKLAEVLIIYASWTPPLELMQLAFQRQTDCLSARAQLLAILLILLDL